MTENTDRLKIKATVLTLSSHSISDRAGIAQPIGIGCTY